MENPNDDIISISVQEMSIILNLLCPECASDISKVLSMWRKQRDENNQQLQSETTRPTERDLDKEIERKIERSDD